VSKSLELMDSSSSGNWSTLSRTGEDCLSIIDVQKVRVNYRCKTLIAIHNLNESLPEKFSSKI